MITHNTMARRRARTYAGLSVTAAVVLAACSNSNDAASTNDEDPAAGAGATSAVMGEGTSTAAGADEAPQESAGPQPRLVATYDGGLLTLDADTLEVVGTVDLPGFLRVNPAGDGRTVFVSTAEGFRVLDAGTWSEPHGDHSHSYIRPPRLTDTVYEGAEPGHVVSHEGSTVLFSDGDGRIQTLATADLRDGEYPDAETREADTPHHGVAVALQGGRMVVTTGDEESRDGAKVIDTEGNEVAATSECPGVHGEAAAAGGRIALGCEDGIVVWDGTGFTKIDSPDPYGRIGNQSGSDASEVVLGDYKVDKDAELERPERISLTDTESGTMRLVDLGTSYSFRSLGRGPDGEALVLGTDGKLHVLDPETGEETSAISVLDEWREPSEWQDPRPTLFVLGDSVYVSDPEHKSLHRVDLAAGEVTDTVEVPEALNEITGVSGDV